MTSPFLIADLIADEGLRLEAYPDPLSGGEPWTIGYGHTGSDVSPGLLWTKAKAEQALIADVMKAKADLDHFLPWWRDLCDARADVLTNMTFNLGITKLLKFERTLACVKASDFAGAAAHMLDSAWARQVPRRAKRLADQMRDGARPTSPTIPPAAAQGQPQAA